MQNPMQAYAYGQNPSSKPVLIKVDAGGNVIPSSTNGPLAAAAALADAVVVSGAAVMSNGLNVFNVAGGPIQILSLTSICQTANDATASTAQWATLTTLGALAGTISGASASLASDAIGEMLVLQGTALGTALLLEATGVGITAVPGSIVVPAGAINLTIGVGSTTGTWKHYMRYRPLAVGAAVAAAF